MITAEELTKQRGGRAVVSDALTSPRSSRARGRGLRSEADSIATGEHRLSLIAPSGTQTGWSPGLLAALLAEASRATHNRLLGQTGPEGYADARKREAAALRRNARGSSTDQRSTVCPCEHDDVSLEFRRCDAARPPASELIDAVLDEYDSIAGRSLSGGPSATPADFSPPSGAFVVGFVDGVPACGGGIKALGDGAAELKRMYVAPPFRGRGLARALLEALENTAREIGHEVMRLDSTSATWPIYVAAGYRQVADYNENPHAEFWGEKRL